MCQINLSKTEVEKNNDAIALNFSDSFIKNQSIKKCDHRNQNGWCNKTQRQCTLLKSIIIHQ